MQKQESCSSVSPGKLGLRESSTSNLIGVEIQQPLPLCKTPSEELIFSHCTCIYAPISPSSMCHFIFLSLLPNRALLSSLHQFTRDWGLLLTKLFLLYSFVKTGVFSSVGFWSADNVQSVDKTLCPTTRECI